METENPNKEPEYRVGSLSFFFLLCVAVLFDLLQALLVWLIGIGQVADLFITFLAVPIFGIAFALHGVSYFSGKKAGAKILTMLGATVVELVPFISALPGMTLGIIGIVLSSRAEDRENAREASSKVRGSIEKAGPTKKFRIPRVQQLRSVNDDERGATKQQAANEESTQPA